MTSWRTDAELARDYGVHVRTIRRLVKKTPRDAFRPWLQFGRLRRWPKSDDAIDKWLRALEASHV